MEFDTKILRGFVQIARYGSMTRAAQALNITQPALTEQIRKFENQIGATLFLRSSSLELTRVGTEILPLARQIIDAADTLNHRLRRLRSGGETFVEFGCAPYLLQAPQRYRLLDGFIRENPGCTPRLDLRDQAELIRSLERGQIDVALVLGWPTSRKAYDDLSRNDASCHGLYPADLPGVVIERRPIELLVPEESSLAAAPAISSEDLGGLCVASFSAGHAPPALGRVHSYLEEAGTKIIVPPEDFPFGVERYARQNRTLAISLGFNPPRVTAQPELLARPLVGLNEFCQLAVLVAPNSIDNIRSRFLSYSARSHPVVGA